MKEAAVGILSGLGVLFVAFLAGRAWKWLGRRVKVKSPEAATLAQVVPAVNALLAVQLPQLDALVALLEATKGKCNGNVDTALDSTKAARARFDGFLVGSAKVEEARQ